MHVFLRAGLKVFHTVEVDQNVLLGGMSLLLHTEIPLCFGTNFGRKMVVPGLEPSLA